MEKAAFLELRQFASGCLLLLAVAQALMAPSKTIHCQWKKNCFLDRGGCFCVINSFLAVAWPLFAIVCHGSESSEFGFGMVAEKWVGAR